MPRDAEAWLAARGVPREPVVDRGAGPDAPPDDGRIGPPPTPAEVLDLARQVARDRAAVAPSGAAEPPADADGPGGPDDPEGPDGPDEGGGAGGAAGALAFIQRSTANAPQSEGRLAEKLRGRGHPEDEVEAALAAARARGLVDDAAMIEALVVERKARGHAEPRLRRDLRSRGFDGAAVDAALVRHRDADPLAAAFATAREQAARHRTAPPETAVRRIVGHLVRRGHAEGVARKAALDAVHADREPMRTAER